MMSASPGQRAKVIGGVQHRQAGRKQLLPCGAGEGNRRRTPTANPATQQGGQAFPQQEKENQDGAGDRSNRTQSSQIGLHCPLGASSLYAISGMGTIKSENRNLAATA